MLSPDGTQIAFDSHRSGRLAVYVMAADGTHVRGLTSSPGDDSLPTWSPRGDRIAFVSYRDGGVGHIYVMPAAGGPARRITPPGEDDGEPSWSPDGTEIVFVRGAGPSRGDLFSVTPAGTGLRQLTTTGYAQSPAVRPTVRG